jgi:hypothetical protein
LPSNFRPAATSARSLPADVGNTDTDFVAVFEGALV